MPHHPKPFFRTGRGWYVQLGKAQIRLCDGPKNATTQEEAWRAYHGRMAASQHAPRHACTIAAGPAGGLTVGEVFEKFLDWCQKHRSPRTFEWSKKHVQMFCDHMKVARTMPARDLKPYHVAEWVDSKATWGPNQKRGAIVALTRPFNWAARLGYIEVSPVRGVEKPQAEKRESRLTPADFELLLSHVKDQPFRDLLTFAYEAGCRPQEARLIEARHLKPEKHRVEIPPPEAKGKRRWRVIYLSDKAAEIVSRPEATRAGRVRFTGDRRASPGCRSPVGWVPDRPSSSPAAVEPDRPSPPDPPHAALHLPHYRPADWGHSCAHVPILSGGWF